MRAMNRMAWRACALLGIAALVAGCASSPKPGAESAGKAVAAAPVAPVAPLPKTDAATLAAIDRALAGNHRSDAERARDAYRHPRETLEFFGLREDMTVMEVWPGAGGWYTAVLAPVLHDHGRYLAAGFDPKSASPAVQDAIRSFQAKLDGSPLYGKVEVTALQSPGALTPVPASSVDLIVTFRNLHNWLAREEAAPAMLKAMFLALKPGGVLGLVDHRADPAQPVDARAKLGYVNEQYAIDLAKAAGFELVAASEINANPRDTRDYEQGVWTLPPTWRLGDKDRDRYAAIGESDRFTLKFRKPAAK